MSEETAMGIVRLRVLGESVLQVRDRCVAPDSPQLFALLLLLGEARGRAVHKTELFDLLFPSVAVRHRAAHSLRQLVYRLRGMGAPIETAGERIRLPEDVVSSTIQDYASMTRHERLGVPASALTILPSYEPTISSQLTDWVETFRSQAITSVRRIIRDDLYSHKCDCDWQSVVTSGQSLRTLEAMDAEVTSEVAEALLMLGYKHKALERIDESLRDCELSTAPALRQLRVRIAKTNNQSGTRESGFCGRSDVMAALARQWDAVTASVPQQCVITGPAGIGKTRLAAEFCSLALLHDGQALRYRCDSIDVSRPHALFRSLLTSLRRMRGSLGASPALQHYLDRLSSEPTLEGPPEAAFSEATRAHLQLAIVDLVEAVASEKPLLIVVDDAHYLDSASLAVIRTVMDKRSPVSVMFVCCYRASDIRHSPLSEPARLRVHRLMPLAQDESLSVLRQLLPGRQTEVGFLQSCVLRAGGNPYYLHAVAQSARANEPATTTPFDVRCFASTTYHSLTCEARALFEVCLLLGRFASIQRVRDIAGMDGLPLMSALRELETGGLLCYSGGELRCAHALLEDASLQLIPTSVAAMLNERIAIALERECITAQYPTALAWAAAENWIAAGVVESASRLMRHCASQAAALGEPHTAAQALLKVPLHLVTLPQRINILREVADYSQAAGDFEQVAASLRTLYQSTKENGCNAQALREIGFQILEAELCHGISPTNAIDPLRDTLRDKTSEAALRVRAGIRLLVAADMNLDEELATSTYHILKSELHTALAETAFGQRAELIYHTVFGDQTRAMEIADSLLRLYPKPDISQLGLSTRGNASFAFSRMGRSDRARPVLVEDVQYMLDRQVLSAALYGMIILAETCLHEGDMATARSWLRDASALLRQGSHTRALEAGYLTAAAEAAIVDQRLDVAEELINQAHARYPAISAPRHGAIELALRLRVQALRCPSRIDGDMRTSLWRLYDRGGHLGAQDTVVEALWLAEQVRGCPDAASHLLSQYLTVRRRAEGPTDWSLRTTTASDPAWSGASHILAGQQARGA